MGRPWWVNSSHKGWEEWQEMSAVSSPASLLFTSIDISQWEDANPYGSHLMKTWTESS